MKLSFYHKTAIVSLPLSLFVIEQVLLATFVSKDFENVGVYTPSHFLVAGISLTSNVLILWLLYYYMRIAASLINNCKFRNISYFLHLAFLLPLLAFAIFYAFSWFFFARLEIFPSIHAIYFAVLNADMLGNYFWQAEKLTLFFWLPALLLYLTLITLLFSWSLRKIRLKLCCKKISTLSLLLLTLCLNTAVISSNLLFIEHRERTKKNNRIEAYKHPEVSAYSVLSHKTNPVVSLACDYFNSTHSSTDDKISLKYLRPIGRIRPSSFPEIPTREKKNVIFITIESLRSDALLMKHQGRKVMPNVHQLLRSGYYFPNCYASSTHSDYSDPAILSSLYPLRRSYPHYYSDIDPWPKVMIYDLLKKYNYATAIFSSQNEAWSNMYLFYATPGLDTLFDSRTHKGHTIAEKGYFSYWLSETGMIAGKLDDSITVKKAISWIEKQCQDSIPFFASINFQTSHFPYELPDGIDGPFKPCELDSNISIYNYPREKIPLVKNAYLNALSYVDLQIGKLVEALKKNGIHKKTIIVITGDHGEAFFENKISGHASIPLETVIKVGLVIHNPSAESLVLDQYLVQAIDIVPTITGLLSLPPHPAFQGIDILNNGRPAFDERTVFVHSCNPVTNTDVVISGTGWKYVIDHLLNTRKLYFRPTDLETHPNLIRKKGEVVKILNNLCHKWRINQLTYYRSSHYYSWFYAPKPPGLTDEELVVLRKQALID